MCIQRQTEKGLPTYGDTDVFTFQVEELVPISDGSYRCKNEFAFMHFIRSGEGWEVRDKSGKVYHLGTVAESRQMKPTLPGPLPADGRGGGFGDTFKWYVNEVIDTHGNRMEYHYTTYPDSPGQLYCTEIRYSISRTDPAIFHSVVFDYETRSDVFSSFISSFEVCTARRCSGIRVLSQGGLVRQYVFNYALNPSDPIEPVSTMDAGLI